MNNPFGNYEVIYLEAGKSYNFYPYDNTNYRTASTVHGIVSLALNASATIYPIKGDSFTWIGSNTDKLDVLISAVTMNAGYMIALKAKNDLNPFYGKGNY